MRFSADILSSLNRIWAILAKEFFTMVMDRGARLVLIVPVIIQSVLFGYGATFNLEQVPWIVYDGDRGALSSELVRGIEANGFFVRSREVTSMQELTGAIDRGEALLGLCIPEGFSSKGEAMLVADARNSTTAGIAAGYVSAVVQEVNSRHGYASPVAVIERFRYNENAVTRYNIIPALIIILSMVQVLILSGLSVAREREEGSFDMMLMTPATTLEILLGKAAVPTLVACVQGFLIFSVSWFWFGIPFKGSLLQLGALVFLFAASLVGFGLAVSAVAKTVQQAMVATVLMLMPFVLLSGVLTPVLGMPGWMQAASAANPVQAAVRALRMMYFEGAGLADVAWVLWPVPLTAVAAMGVAGWMFRHKVS